MKNVNLSISLNTLINFPYFNDRIVNKTLKTEFAPLECINIKGKDFLLSSETEHFHKARRTSAKYMVVFTDNMPYIATSVKHTARKVLHC